MPSDLSFRSTVASLHGPQSRASAFKHGAFEPGALTKLADELAANELSGEGGAVMRLAAIQSTEGIVERYGGTLFQLQGHGLVPSPAAVMVANSSRVEMIGCTFERLGAWGVRLYNGTQASAVRRCRFADLSGGGVMIGNVNDTAETDPERHVHDDDVWLGDAHLRLGDHVADGRFRLAALTVLRVCDGRLGGGPIEVEHCVRLRDEAGRGGGRGGVDAPRLAGFKLSAPPAVIVILDGPICDT